MWSNAKNWWAHWWLWKLKTKKLFDRNKRFDHKTSVEEHFGCSREIFYTSLREK